MALNFNKPEFVRSAGEPRDFLRDGLPQFAFAGRSNVGKSSVINRLVGRKNLAYVGASPGKTTHINYFRIDGKAYLVDLPGYGYAKVSQAEKARWARLMESYFQSESEVLTAGVLIVDIRHQPTANDLTMLPGDRGGQQAGQAEEKPGGASPASHPGDPGAGGGGHPHPLFRREGHREGGAHLPPDAAQPVRA